MALPAALGQPAAPVQQPAPSPPRPEEARTAGPTLPADGGRPSPSQPRLAGPPPRPASQPT
eukprot:3968339-Alexandrium_andersonii.AAC.1